MPLGDKNYYKILQVDPSAELEVIEAAYKQLARMYHPDINRSPNATRHMQEINTAYEILKDPARRAQHDRDLSSQSSSSSTKYAEEQRKRDEAEAAWRLAKEEQQRREQAEAEAIRRRAEEEQHKRDEAEAARRRRTEEEQRKREEADKQSGGILFAGVLILAGIFFLLLAFAASIEGNFGTSLFLGVTGCGVMLLGFRIFNSLRESANKFQNAPTAPHSTQSRFVTFDCPYCSTTIYQRVAQCMFCDTPLTDEAIDTAVETYRAQRGSRSAKKNYTTKK